nr:WEB family protein At1g12150-like [Ipomoea batatas]
MSSELENGSVDNLRMQIKNAGGHRSESAKIGDRLSCMETEMMAAQGKILGLEAQLAGAEAVKTALTKEKLKSEKLERTVAELKETNLQLRAAAREAAANREAEMQNLEKELAEKDALVERLKLELGQTKELNLSSEKIASETIAELNHKTGKMKAELDEMRSQADRILESEVENALLKVELHKWRSKAAAAEAAEERCKREIFALNRALQLTAASQQASSSINNVTIFRKEYEALSNKADEQVTMMEEKLGKLERDLMTATHKIREMRTRAEQAISRAEAAEKAKAELEVKIKRRKENEKEKKEFFKNLRDQINSSREAAATPDIIATTSSTPSKEDYPDHRQSSSMIMNSELENGSVENLRMQIKDAGGHRSEIGDRLSRMATEIMAAQGEILGLEAQLAGAEAVKTALTKEKLKSEELERTVAELKETNLQLREAAANREAEMQNLEKELAEKDALVERLKLELGQTKELNLSSEKIASETIADLNHKTGKMKAELDEIRSQADRILESEVENALLKVELHKWRSKAAAAEAAVERCKREIFALNRALQLTAAASQQASSSINNVTISRNEYEALSNKADEQVTMMEEKLGKLERELITATHKIREMRTRAEQAISRAEAAEKAKAELEVKIKRRKEKEKEKKEFFKNLRDQINSSKEAAATPDIAANTPAIQTLSNVLEIPL